MDCRSRSCKSKIKVLSSGENLLAALYMWKTVCSRPRRAKIKKEQKEIKQVAEAWLSGKELAGQA